MSRFRLPPVISLLYTHNPFYLISACLFVYGLKLLFRVGDQAILFQRGAVGYIEPWGLLGSLAAVTVLMSVTAVLVVRLGKVWEDARSLLLIVLLMLVAISVSLDELVHLLTGYEDSWRRLIAAFGIGTGFALGVAEILLRSLRIRLNAAYRIPLYAFLTLFFLWPAVLLPELTSFSTATTRWLIAAFPAVAGLLTLSLLPAVWQGSVAVQENGTPWKWPLFPWTPFVFVALTVCFRAYSFTMSFDGVPSSGFYWDTIFGLYQLVPFLLAILFLLLEIGRVEKLASLQHGVMLTAPLLLIAAYPWMVPWHDLLAYRTFAYHFVNSIGSPVFLTLIGLFLFYGWAWLRRVRYAEVGLSATMLLLSCIGPQSFGARAWQPEIQPWGLLLLAVFLIVHGVSRSQSFSVFVGVGFVAVTGHLATAGIAELEPWRKLLVAHFVLMAAVIIGAVFRDLFADVLSELGPPCTFVLSLVSIGTIHGNDLSMWVPLVYVAGVLAATLLLARLLQSRGYRLVAILECFVILAGGVLFGIRAFQEVTLLAGVKQVILATISFGVAVFISVLKSGLSRRIRMYWATRRRAIRAAQ